MFTIKTSFHSILHSFCFFVDVVQSLGSTDLHIDLLTNIAYLLIPSCHEFIVLCSRHEVFLLHLYIMYINIYIHIYKYIYIIYI